MAEQQLFGYTPTTGGSRVSTQPFQSNIQARNPTQGLDKAMNAVIGIMGQVKQENDKSSFMEAATRINQAKDKYVEDISNTPGAYERAGRHAVFEQEVNTIQGEYELTEDYKYRLSSSTSNFVNGQKLTIREGVRKQQLVDTDNNALEMIRSVVSADVDTIVSTLKDIRPAYNGLDSDENSKSSRVFKMTASLLIKDLNPTSDIQQAKQTLIDIATGFDKKLINKPEFETYLAKFDSLIKDQKATSKAHINTFLISEAITTSEFNAEVDKFSTIYTPLEINNFKEAKANKAYELKIRNETRAYKENRKYNEDHKIEATNKLNNVKTMNSVFGPDTPTPSEVNSWIKIKNADKAIPQEDLQLSYNYDAQWNIENDELQKQNIINTPSSHYIGTRHEQGVKDGIKNVVNKAYSSETFNANEILTIYKNHDITGSIKSFALAESNNPKTAPIAVMKFKQLKDSNRPAAMAIYGDKLFNKLEALSAMVQTGATGEPEIEPNAFRYINEIGTTGTTVDLSEFNDELEDNPKLGIYSTYYKTAIGYRPNDHDTIMSEIKDKVKQEYPTDGVFMLGHSENLDPEDIKTLPDAISRLRKKTDYIGVARNPDDGHWYMSDNRDLYAYKMAYTDSDGNKQPITSLKTTMGVIHQLEQQYGIEPGFLGIEGDDRSIATRLIDDLSELKTASDWMLNLNPKQTKDGSIKAGKSWQDVKDLFESNKDAYAELPPEEKKRVQAEVSRVQKLLNGDKEFLEALKNMEGKTPMSSKGIIQVMNNENSVKKGWSGSVWKPHKSVEGGNDTLAYGHKITDEENTSGAIYGINFKGGITQQEAEAIFNKDVERVTQNLDIEAVDRDLQLLVTDVAFRLGETSTKNSKFLKAIKAGDIDEAFVQMADLNYTTPSGKKKSYKKRNIDTVKALGLWDKISDKAKARYNSIDKRLF